MEKESESGLLVACRKDRGVLAIAEDEYVVWEAQLTRGVQRLTTMPYLLESVREMVRSDPNLREADESGVPLVPFPTEAEEEAALLEGIARSGPALAAQRLRHRDNQEKRKARRESATICVEPNCEAEPVLGSSRCAAHIRCTWPGCQKVATKWIETTDASDGEPRKFFYCEPHFKGRWTPHRKRPPSFYRDRLDPTDFQRTAKELGGYSDLSRFLYDVRVATRFYRLYLKKFEPTLDGLTNFIIRASQLGVDILACREVRDEILARAELRRLLAGAKPRLSATRYANERKNLKREMEKLGRALAGLKQGRLPKSKDKENRSRRHTVDGAADEPAVLAEQERIIEQTGQSYGSWRRATDAVAKSEPLKPGRRRVTGAAIRKRLERIPPRN
jgi:hypothetical protein